MATDQVLRFVIEVDDKGAARVVDGSKKIAGETKKADSALGKFGATLQRNSRTLLASNLRLKLSHRIGIVRHFANSLVILGLIGTVIGFIIALSGVDPENASDINAVTPMISTLVAGMSTALYTTLVGAVLNIWLMTNYHMLTTGTVKLITALVELGETHARP